jgi:putative DNA primase/helicase
MREDLRVIDGERAEVKDPSPRLSVPILDFLKREMPQTRPLLAPWLRTAGLTMVHAWRGVGKTHFGIGVACAVATGGRYLKWTAPEPARVLYVDGEMPAAAMQDRFRSELNTLADPDMLRIVSPDLLPADHLVPNLLTAEGQAALEADIEDRDLAVFDNVATLFRTEEDQNSVSAWMRAQDYVLRLRRRGLGVLLVDHDNKSGGNRGTSAKHDVLDVVIQLKQPTDYLPSQGARFEVNFTKHRGFWGNDTLPFEAQLMEGPTGPIWAIADAEDAMRKRVSEMMASGCKERDIRDELDIGGSKLARFKKELAEAEKSGAEK